MWYRYPRNYFFSRVVVAGKKDIINVYLGGDASLWQKVEYITDVPKLQPIAAYFVLRNEKNKTPTALVFVGRPNHIHIHKDAFKDVFTELGKILLKNKNLNIYATKNGIVFKDDIIQEFLPFSERIHAISSLINPQKKIERNDVDLHLPTDNHQGITVQKINNVSEAISGGAGTPWCISQPYNKMWQSYRDLNAATFYFVVDNTRTNKDPLRKVAVNVNKNGVDLTDMNNSTGNIAEFENDSAKYFAYLADNRVNVSQFKNDPVTEEEEGESFLLVENSDTRWFTKLRFDYKSKYIGRGNKLTDEQFQYLVDNKADELITQYVNTGMWIGNNQLNSLTTNQRKTFNHSRDIAADIFISHYGKYNALDQYRDSLNKSDDDERLDMEIRFVNKQGASPDEVISSAAHSGNLKLVQWLIEEKNADPNEAIVGAAHSGNLKLVQWLIEEKGVDLNLAISGASSIENLEMVKWLIENGADQSKAISYAASAGNTEMVKWLIVEKGVHPSVAIPQTVFTGNLEMVKWLIEVGADINTAIQYALGSEKFEIFKWLVGEKGADLNEAINSAKHFENPDIVEWLKERMTKTPAPVPNQTAPELTPTPTPSPAPNEQFPEPVPAPVVYV